MDYNSFGLGIVISVKDMATPGLNAVGGAFDNVMNKFSNGSSEMNKFSHDMANSLALIGMNSTMVGNMFTNVSSNMLNPLKQLTTGVMETSSKFENWGVTLEALYKDVGIAQEKLKWGMDLAAKTPFQIEDVTSALIGFKAMGVDADAQFKNANGELRTLLEYVGDLGALRPDIGLSGVMAGVRNLIGGDGGKSIKLRMDMDFEQILGREWGDTTEQITKDIAEVSDKIANGLMQKMEGTWEQIISNMQDQKTRLFKAIGDAGVFDAVKDSLVKFSKVVQGIDDEKLAKIGSNLKDSFSILWKPIDLLATVLAKALQGLLNLLAKDSALSTFVGTFLAVGGALTGLVGIGFKVFGSFLQTISILGMFALMILSSARNVTVLTSALALIKTTLGALLLKAAKFALVAGAVALAWKTNFLGIRTTVTNLANTIGSAFSKSKELAMGSCKDMITGLNALLDEDTFYGRLVFRLTQLRVLFGALVEYWNNGELSDETFKKVQALGLLPLLQCILDVKMRFEAFCKGFSEGFNKVNDVAKKVFKAIGDIINELGKIFEPALQDVDTVKSTLEGEIDLSSWENVGKVFGVVAPILFITWAGIKLFQGASAILTPLIAIVGSVVGAIMSFAMTNPVMMAVIVVIGLLVTAGLWLRDNWDTISSNVREAFQKMSTKAGEIKDSIVSSFETLYDKVSEWWGKLKDVLSAPITATVNFVKGMFGGKKDGSHYNGLSNVPFDGYVAELHKGERVLTASENREYSASRKDGDKESESKLKSLLPRTEGTSQVTNDNSLTFSEGSIQISLAQATEQEALRLAKIIMDKIKKEQQLRNTLKYKTI